MKTKLSFCESQVSSLEQAALSPDEVRLREDQISVISSFLEFFKSGEHAGYFDIATGVGKTAIAIDIARKLDLKTLILGNTRLNVKQNMRETEKFAPGVVTTAYHARDKDLSGQIVHMTYPSALNFFVKGKTGKNSGFDPNSFDLIFCDEADLGIGQETYRVYRVFPHALKVAMTATPEFSAVDRLIAKGIVREDEEWVDMFRNNIHTYDLEEAQERGTLVPSDIHFLKTNTQVSDIQIESNGEYSQSDLERYLATESRNELVVAMLLGVGKLKQSVRISNEQKIELDKLHQKIKGKRTAIFGISINHIKELGERLAKEGLSVAVMYGETSDDQREEINRKYAEGEIQVVLGVDMLARAWNSPAIEVIIDLQPNYSGRKLKQKFGRGLRLSPETGKEKLIAIQLVDQFAKRGQSPVLLSDLYDPEFVLSGANIGVTGGKNGHPKNERKLIVSFSGMDIELILEEAKSRDLIKNRFKKGSIEETADFFEKLVQEGLSENPEIRNYELFKRILADLPPRIPIEAQEKAIQALASMDTNIKNLGQKAFLLLNMKSILTVVDSFLIEGVDSPEDREEMLSVGIDAVALKLPNIRVNKGGGAGIAQQVYVAAKRAIAEFIARKNNLPPGMINDLADRKFVIKRIQEALGGGNVLTNDDLKKLAEEFSSQTGANRKEVFNWLTLLNTRGETEDDSLFGVVSKTLLKEDMEKVLDTLHDREKRVLELRFGLGYGGSRTLEEAGEEFGVGKEAIRRTEAIALRKLRHPSRSKKLTAYLDEGVDRAIAFPETEYSRGSIGYEKPRTTRELQELQYIMRKRNIFDIRNLSINRIEMDRLESCGIREIGDFLTAPMEEIEQEWRTEFDNDQDLKNVVGEVIFRINTLQNDPKFRTQLIEHIVNSVIYRDKEKAFNSLDSHEKEALEMKLKLRDRSISGKDKATYESIPFVYDWIAKIAEEKIFKNAYKELEKYALGKPARKKPKDSSSIIRDLEALR